MVLITFISPAMGGLSRLNVPFYYDALTTMISALAAILLTGIALLIVHFGERTPKRIILAGLVVGVGIVVMHYLGMSGIREVKPLCDCRGFSVDGRDLPCANFQAASRASKPDPRRHAKRTDHQGRTPSNDGQNTV